METAAGRQRAPAVPEKELLGWPEGCSWLDDCHRVKGGHESKILGLQESETAYGEHCNPLRLNWCKICHLHRRGSQMPNLSPIETERITVRMRKLAATTRQLVAGRQKKTAVDQGETAGVTSERQLAAIRRQLV